MKEALHKGHRERLRNRVQKESLINFEDYQVLEYILTFVIPQKDTNPIAHRLINTFGSISRVLEADIKDLEKVDGIGHITAMFLNSYLGVLYHYDKDKNTAAIVIDTPKQAGDYYKNLLKYKTEEEMYLTFLDSKNQVVYNTVIKSGTDKEIKVTPKQVIELVVRHDAKNIIICHNHPLGSPNPSSEDIRFTKALALSLTLHDVKILDHVVICKSGFYSFNASGKIDEYVESAKKVIASQKTDVYYSGDINQKYGTPKEALNDKK